MINNFNNMPELAQRQYSANKKAWESAPDKNSDIAVKAHADNEKLRQMYGIGSDDLNYSSFNENVLNDRYRQQNNRYLKKLSSTYKSPYQRQKELDAEAVRNFSYDPEQDSLYKSYRDMYTRQGLSAQDKTVSNLTALSGGRNNSWASAAAAQVGQAYAQKSADMIPQLAEAAYNRLLQRYNISKDMDNTDYSRYADQWNRDKSMADTYYNMLNSERENTRADERQAWDRENNALTTDYMRFYYGMEKEFAPTERLLRRHSLENQLKQQNIELEYLPQQLQNQVKNGMLTNQQLQIEIDNLPLEYKYKFRASEDEHNLTNAQINKLNADAAASRSSASSTGQYTQDEMYNIIKQMVEQGDGDSNSNYYWNGQETVPESQAPYNAWEKFYGKLGLQNPWEKAFR